MSTNSNKINVCQKIILGEFMDDHPNFAKNKIPNCVQGRATSARLWKDLTVRLNLEGPPVKDEKIWRKVFADQKYKLKKKLSHNKKSLAKTSGGPYDIMELTPTEELIVSASGLEASVSGLNVKVFGAANHSNVEMEENFENIDVSCSSEHIREKALIPIPSGGESNEEPLQENRGTKKRTRPSSSKDTLFTDYINLKKESNNQIAEKLDKIVLLQEKRLEIEKERLEIEKKRLVIKEKSLKLNEERFRTDLHNKEIELGVLKTANELKSLKLSKF